jgi:CDP-glycerol glycerophosphotransferase
MGNVSSVTMSQYAEGQIRPLMSVVVPVYNLEDYLGRCLDSITQQKLDDIEIVVVDGQSTDGSANILDERRGKDPRFTIIYAGRIGPGRARNMGAEAATGEYLWFVDGDDIVSADCMTAIADRLEVTRPDVLFLGHDEIHPDGDVRPGPGHGLMTRETEACFTLAEQPWVTHFSMASWNKVIRREFFLSRPVLFLPDWPHEDVPVSCLLLLDASRLSILNQTCYRHVKDRDGSAMAEAGNRHFRIFDSYELVLDRMEARLKSGDATITAAVRLALFHRAIWHYTTIFDSYRPGVNPLSGKSFIEWPRRREFFGKMHDHFVRYVPPVYEHPKGFRGIKFRLVKMNAYRAYSILDPANRLRVSAASDVAAALHRIQQAGWSLRRRLTSLRGA